MITSFAFLVFLALSAYVMALFDVFFAFCPQGRIKVIVKGKSYHDFIHSVAGWKKEGNILRPLRAGEAEDFGGFFGIYWIGLWPLYRVYWYRFEWETIVEGKIVTRNEWVNTIFFHFEYPLQFRGMETSDNFKVSVVMQVLPEVFCPEKALFKARNWLNVLKAGVESKVRDFIGGFSFEEIRGKKTEVAEDKNDFVRQIIDLSKTDLTTDTNPGFEDTVGSRVISANFQRIDADDPSAIQALERVAIAEREGQARIKAAEKDLEVMNQKVATRIREAEGERAFLDATLMHIAGNPTAAGIEKVRSLPKTITTLVQEGAVNVNLGGDKK